MGKIYATKMGVDKEKMMKRLWGDSFFNAKKKTWTNVMQPEGCDKPLPRACQFIMTPINQLMRAIMDDQKDKYSKMMETLGIVLKGDDRNLLGKPLMKRSMQIWINAADTLLNMIVSSFRRLVRRRSTAWRICMRDPWTTQRRTPSAPATRPEG